MKYRHVTKNYSTANGYSSTTPGNNFTALLAQNGFDVDLTLLARNTPLAVKNKRPQKKVYKYTCPVCGATVKSTMPVNIRCMDCDQDMEI